MKLVPSNARILVATDSTDDAQQILRQLKDNFDQVKSSTDPDRSVQDFEDYRPDVLVLAFDNLDKAQRYYLGLYRLGQVLQQHTHRTVILCNRDEVKAVFDLCKKQYFDDYVLYWPHTFDGPRLAMSIWSACREMTALKSDVLRPAELVAHAKHVGDLDRLLGKEFKEGERHLADASRSLLRVEQEVSEAIDDFSRRLVSPTGSGTMVGGDEAQLMLEIEELKKKQLAQVRRVGASTVEPVNAWARGLRSQVEPALIGARATTAKLSKVKLLVMVVEDDPLAIRMVELMLDKEVYEVAFASSGPEAFAQLRRIRPDVILMDIRLPGQDGMELTRRLKASPDLTDIPVVMMTGDARRETLAGSVAAGAVAFIVKPFTRESLIKHLEKVLPR